MHRMPGKCSSSAAQQSAHDLSLQLKGYRRQGVTAITQLAAALFLLGGASRGTLTMQATFSERQQATYPL